MRRWIIWGVTVVVVGVVIALISVSHSQRPCLMVKPTDCSHTQAKR